MPNQWKTVNRWSIKGPLLALALLLGMLQELFRFKESFVLAGIAMAVPIIGFQYSWSKRNFWLAVVLLTLIQIPVAYVVEPSIERLGFPLALAFTMIDLVLVVVVLSHMCDGSGGRG